MKSLLGLFRQLIRFKIFSFSNTWVYNNDWYSGSLYLGIREFYIICYAEIFGKTAFAHKFSDPVLSTFRFPCHGGQEACSGAWRAPRAPTGWGLETREARPSFLPLTLGEPESQPQTPFTCFLNTIFPEILRFLPPPLLLSPYLPTMDPFVL